MYELKHNQFIQKFNKSSLKYKKNLKKMEKSNKEIMENSSSIKQEMILLTHLLLSCSNKVTILLLYFFLF